MDILLEIHISKLADARQAAGLQTRAKYPYTYVYVVSPIYAIKGHAAPTPNYIG